MLGEYSRMRAGVREAGTLDEWPAARVADGVERDLSHEALPLP